MVTLEGDSKASLNGNKPIVDGDNSTASRDFAAISEDSSVKHGDVSTANGGAPIINEGLHNRTGDAPARIEITSAVKDLGKEPVSCDVVVVGAGFSGISAMYKLRKLGMSVKTFEAGSDFGGVWYWNRYPGARVDSEFPFYQLNIPEVWRTWNFSERFPGHEELRRYFDHVDKTLGLRKDVEFNARVVDASYDSEKAKWTVKTSTGSCAIAKYLILATGLLHRTYTPNFPGLNEYKGELYHSGFWPQDVEVKGKNIALIGAGATAVQITQEIGKQADHLTVFLRRPSMCLPMGQRPLTELENLGMKSLFPKLFEAGRLSRAGFPTGGPPCGVFDVTKEERETWFEELWARGGFNYQMCNYNDVIVDKKANREVYDFWAKKIRARISDPVKRDIMAPLEPPFFFGTKRNPLENGYYEVLDQPNVEIVDLNKTPLKTFRPTGMLMADDKLREFDMVVLATGFDSFTGSLTNMGLKNKHGVDMKEVWKDGVWTYLGVMTNGFPNMFMVYTPQAPTALSNGSTILECQLDFAINAIAKLEQEGAKSIEPLHSSEVEWKELINMMTNMTLFPFTDSWWTGGNVPGKKTEAMTYIGGIDNYEKQCQAAIADWNGFEVIKEQAPLQEAKKDVAHIEVVSMAETKAY